MPAALAIPLVIGAVGAGASVASGVMGSKAAHGAADTQAEATRYAADKSAETEKQNLDFQKQVYGTQQEQLAPYMEQGKVALGQLGAGIQAGGEFSKPYDASTILKDDPGYQFRMDEGLKALERTASATGSLGSGGTLRRIERYGQEYASNEYGAAANRYQTNRNTRFGELTTVAGIGQNGVNASGNAGNAAAQNMAQISTNATNAQNELMTSGAAAQAAGQIGAANAWSGALSGIGQSMASAYSLYTQGKKS
jgi:hypothetical protein